MNTPTSPKVQYIYANGSANTVRVTGMTYPNGRSVTDSYGTTDDINDASSRIQSMKDVGASDRTHSTGCVSVAQQSVYTDGTTRADSAIASSQLLVSVQEPHPTQPLSVASIACSIRRSANDDFVTALSPNIAIAIGNPACFIEVIHQHCLNRWKQDLRAP